MSKRNAEDDKFSIKYWKEDDKPREKLISKGRQSLSDAELIAILIGSGTRHESAVQLSQRILREVGNDLNSLGKSSLSDLLKFKGIGNAKAISIIAALEIGRRRKESNNIQVNKITDSESAFRELYPHLADLDHEQFFVLLLNRANAVIDVVRVSQGGVAGTVADTKLIFKKAIDRLASSIILAHNHPSGNLQASQADIQLTKHMIQAGKILEIAVLDHLIVAGNDYFSFADDGLI